MDDSVADQLVGPYEIILMRQEKPKDPHPPSYYDASWGGPRRIRMVAERIWRRDSYSRWKRGMMNQAVRIAAKLKEMRDPGWGVINDTKWIMYEKEMNEESEIEDSWMDFAYVEEGKTPEWVKSMANEDPVVE